MNRHFLGMALAALTLLPATASRAQPVQPAQTPESGVLGTWINPRGTVKVQTGTCPSAPGGSQLCGWVVWAGPQALADARDSGITRLLGTELLRDYHRSGPGLYRGQVYVPDMGRTFYSTIEQNGANNLKISGCILGGLICKSQQWHRS